MQRARYERETIGNRHCLFLVANGQRHLIATSRAVDNATYGPALDAPAHANNPVVATPPATPTRPVTVRVRSFNLRRAVASAKRRGILPIVFPAAPSRGHVAWHDGREFAVIAGRVYAGPSDAPLGTNGYRRGLRPFASLEAFRLWATRNRVRVARRPNNPVVARVE
jgi:hypothetical protein